MHVMLNLSTDGLRRICLARQGLVKEQTDPKAATRANSGDPSVRNSLWIYNMDRCSWYCVYENKTGELGQWSEGGGLEPCPRYAHQFVYDTVNKVRTP